MIDDAKLSQRPGDAPGRPNPIPTNERRVKAQPIADALPVRRCRLFLRAVDQAFRQGKSGD